MPYRIDFRQGHLNGQGQAAPWVIINEDRDEIVGSSKSKEDAEASIRAREAVEHGGHLMGKRRQS